MLPSLVPLTLIAAVAAFLIHKSIQKYLWNRKYKLPPRVLGVPFFGNTFQAPVFQQGRWAREKARQYGEMFTCQFGSNTWVFLNSSRVVTDLLEKRAPIYSSGPEYPMTQKRLSGNSRVVLMPYCDRWRALRKIMHQVLNTRQADKFKPYQELESKQLLYDYLYQPDKWHIANQQFVNSVIMSAVFGRRMELDDPEMKELFDSSENFLENLQPGANLVDGFQFLDRLPTFLHWWRPYGDRWHQFTVKVYRREVNRLIEKMKNGTAKPCFAVDFLKAADGGPFPFDETQKTVYSRLSHRSWQRHHTHVDKPERLPVFDDKPNLPYITAAVKEGFRWRPFAEIGMPHVLTQDDEYEGYKFPAGTIFTWNASSIALDPREYEDPERFYPERFLNEDLDNPMKGHWAFGAGRRVCAGWNVGATNLWIAVARLIYCFDFEQDPDKPIDTMAVPWQEHKTAPFSVKIKVRSPKHAALIERDCLDTVNAKY